MPGPWFLTANTGVAVVGIEISCDMEPTPAIVRINFKWQPQTREAENSVMGQGGMREQLQQCVGPLGYDKKVEAWTFPWTDAASRGFTVWCQEKLAGRGFSAASIMPVLQGMTTIPAATENPGLSRLTASVGAIPPGALIKIDSLEKCPEALWEKLLQIPGVFIIQPSGRPMPIRGTWAKGYFNAYHMHPSPAYVSAVHVESVARLFPQVAAVKDQIRFELGIDYPLHPPEQFSIPGIDPETRQRFRLLPFQAEAVSKAIAMRRMLLIMGVGTGKTFCALAVAHTLLVAGKIDRVIVIAPRRQLKPVWAAEAMKFYGIIPIIAHGDPMKRRGNLLKAAMTGGKMILTTYDSFRLADAQSHLLPFLGPRTLVIIDEVHYLKHSDTKRYAAIRRALDGIRMTPGGAERFLPGSVVDYRLFMTGTLAHDKLIDIFAPAQLLGFHAWSTEDEFQSLYFHREIVRTNRIDARTGQPMTKMHVARVKPEMLPALQEVIANLSFYRTREEIGLQLPPLQKRNWVIEPTGYEQIAYAIIKGDLQRLMDQALKLKGQTDAGQSMATTQFQEVQQNLLAAISLERQFSCDPALVVISTSPSARQIQQRIGAQNLISLSPGSKMQTLIDMLGNFLEQPNGKVVVFTSFARVLTVMQALMTRPPPRLDTDEIYNLRLIAGTCLYYHGELTDEQGNEVLRKFKDNPRYRVLFTTDAGGQGINLQECASFIIHYDAPLSMGQLEQREGRVYRRGQKLPVLIQSLTYAPQEEMQQALGSFSTKLSAGNARFVDPKLVAMLRNKATEVKAFMDGL